MKTYYKIFFVTGIILLVVNIYGLFRTMRNPAIYSEEKTLRNRVNDISVKYPEIKQQFTKRSDESNVAFGLRINKLVNNGFIHYWKVAGIEKYHERVPVWENYILYAASYIYPQKYKMYEFSNYKKNLERGVGLCSTHSTIVKGVLLENGIKAELLDIGGHHVVVRAELDSTHTYILDPDFGIVVPHDTAEISLNPEIVRDAYKDMAKLYYPDAKDPYTTDFMVEIFGKHKHTYVLDNQFEYFSYWAIWMIPVLLILPVIFSFIRKRYA
jgi:hypothetical protein